MRIFIGVPPPAARSDCALTIGNFDGVHRGHMALLERVVALARGSGLIPAAMTFEPHPREFFAAGPAPERIYGLRDKVAALAAAGIDRVFVQHFDARLAACAAEPFIDRILVDGCAVRYVVIGDDFRFGTRRTGDAVLLRAHARDRYGVEVISSVSDREQRVSSSAIRAALAGGELARAAALLGRPYALAGRVVRGRRLGRRIGFPTLNLRFARGRPAARGIFVVRVDGLPGGSRAGVASLGLRPTVDSSGRWMLEVHLFDFEADVYGKLVRVEFLHKLRDEQTYPSLEALTAAIDLDASRARAWLAGADAPTTVVG